MLISTRSDRGRRRLRNNLYVVLGSLSPTSTDLKLIFDHSLLLRHGHYFLEVQKLNLNVVAMVTTVRLPDLSRSSLRLKLFFNYPAIDTSPVETQCAGVHCLSLSSFCMSETSSASVASNSVLPLTNMAFVSHSGNWEGEYKLYMLWSNSHKLNFFKLFQS